jgi:hypothetical protein
MSSYVSIPYQQKIYNTIPINSNITDIIIKYIRNPTSWKRISYSKDPYYLFVPNDFIPTHASLVNVQHSQHIFQQLMSVTDKYIDPNNLWRNFFTTVTTENVIPLISSSTQYDSVCYENVEVLSDNNYNYNYIYKQKIVRTWDAYKTFKISLMPSDQQEYVSHISLYIKIFDQYIPVSELIPTNTNEIITTFSLPYYFSHHPHQDYYLQFIIENNKLERSRYINVESIILNNDKRNTLEIEKMNIVL